MVASPAAAANPAASLSLRGDSTEASGSAETSAALPAAETAQSDTAYAGGAGLSSPLIIGGLVLLVIIGAVALGSGHHGSTSASA
jgi:hypothetical protein